MFISYTYCLLVSNWRLHRDYQIDVKSCDYLLEDSTTKTMQTLETSLEVRSWRSY